jgi:peptide/nickel transport system permease protein
MKRFLLARALSLVPTLVGVSVLVFLMIRLIPGTVVERMLGSDATATPEAIASLRAFFGLDRPLAQQYGEWMARVVVGDFGTSWRSAKPVLGLLLDRFVVTAELTLLASCVSLAVGIPLGILSAVRQRTGLDNLTRVASLFGLSMPVFWQGTMLILLCSLALRWTPPVRWAGPLEDWRVNLQIILLPAICLGTASAATIMRMTRATMLEILGHEYIRTARAKGLEEPRVIRRHALRNVLIPLITVAGLQVGFMLGGIVVVEEVFTLPGVGRLILEAIYQRDYPLVQGGILFVAGLFMLTNLGVDLLYGLIDPRIRHRT